MRLYLAPRSEKAVPLSFRLNLTTQSISVVLSGLPYWHQPLTPHSASRRAASLYVGLKSFALSGHLRNIPLFL
ncbi:hypothetical protein Barb4_00685 [Bacteroidales bacterium Barb4]|nr:hypothetical protein Barb4_00685 [Bacteroidales bacterium Barb4]